MKKNLFMSYRSFFLALFISTGIISCSSDDDAVDTENNNSDTAQVRIELTDAPGDYDAVNVEVVDVMVKMDVAFDEETTDPEGWVSLEDVQTGTYDLLELTGGITQILADTELPAGHLQQIRLVLGNGNTITVDGQNLSLETPSAEESGLKLQVNEELEAGKDYVFLLDFDVEQSIVKTGSSGNYILKPVIRVSTQEAGSISGSIHPTNHQALVVATNGSTTISAYTDDEGNFKLNGVPAGTYMVVVTPDAVSGYAEATINNVQVEQGSETDLDVVFLEETTGTQE